MLISTDIGNVYWEHMSSVLPKGTKEVTTDGQEDPHTYNRSLSLAPFFLLTKLISLRLSLWGVRKEQHVGSSIECEILNMFVIYRGFTNTLAKGQKPTGSNCFPSSRKQVKGLVHQKVTILSSFTDLHAI